MKIKTIELTGKPLDYGVAVAEGYTDLRMLTYSCNNPNCWECEPNLVMTAPDGVTMNADCIMSEYSCWGGIGPIIERERINIRDDGGDQWAASYLVAEMIGPTPLVAAMRCYVASKLGDEIDVPEELI